MLLSNSFCLGCLWLLNDLEIFEFGQAGEGGRFGF